MPGAVGKGVLDIDCASESERIAGCLKNMVWQRLHRRGVVIALSGGVDSSVCAALAARGLGSSRVLALLLPERESSPSSLEFGRLVAEQLGIRAITENITGTLDTIGCYRWRDEAIRSLLPEYGPGWKSKLVLGVGGGGPFRVFKLVARAPDGSMHERRLRHRAYFQLVAAQSYKQRIRKAIEYFHADRLNYAVLGTPNRLEYDQGFFVKNGDGSADAKPIAHLYKTQVYALARHLGLPEEIRQVRPTTDTYALPQDQDEFYFTLPYEQMDVALWAHNHQWPASELAATLRMDEAQARMIYADIEAKRKVAQYLHAKALLVQPVDEIQPLG
jgi:NAD+ synthase